MNSKGDVNWFVIAIIGSLLVLVGVIGLIALFYEPLLDAIKTATGFISI